MRGRSDCPICGNSTTYITNAVCRCNKCEQQVVAVYDVNVKRFTLHGKDEFEGWDVEKILENKKAMKNGKLIEREVVVKDERTRKR